jgi:hypothetical protein
MALERPFRYCALCSAPRCDQPAIYKIASSWSDGTSHELKNYGLACEQHRNQQLAAARGRLHGLSLREAETVAPIELYRLIPHCRDRDLVPIPSD